MKNCARCKKFEGAPPIAKLKKLPCSSPGEILHIDYTSIEETVDLNEKPVICNVLVMQDHFFKHVVAYVVKDQKAKTAAKALRWGYFGLFRAPAYLVSDQGGTYWEGGREPREAVRSSEAQNVIISCSDQWSSGADEPNSHPHDREAG